eukprot:365192-Chlamydomonas_euryale.AAC.14
MSPSQTANPANVGSSGLKQQTHDASDKLHAAGQRSVAMPGRLGRVLSRLRSVVHAAVQVAQLLLVTGALILWPASLAPGGLLLGRVWLLYCVYVIFFGFGTLYRMLVHGELMPRARDKQRSTSWASRLQLAAFIIAVPVLHWLPMLRFCGMAALGQMPVGMTWYDALGIVLVLCAIGLNAAAARALGKVCDGPVHKHTFLIVFASPWQHPLTLGDCMFVCTFAELLLCYPQAYDRIAPPDKLVTTDVYSVVQHPIYTSYMLLFSGFCLLLHSAPSALLLTAVCATYYR